MVAVRIKSVRPGVRWGAVARQLAEAGFIPHWRQQPGSMFRVWVKP